MLKVYQGAHVHYTYESARNGPGRWKPGWAVAGNQIFYFSRKKQMYSKGSEMQNKHLNFFFGGGGVGSGT